MRSNQASKTAELAAAVRAAHLIYDSPVVFRDEFAIGLTSPFWRIISQSRILHQIVVNKLLATLRPVHGQVLGRARYCEDALIKAVAAGIRQYVIVGAGLDSFGLRHPELSGSLKIFELDHPASQESKRHRVIKLTGEIPRNIAFVPVDFEMETVADALRRSSFVPTQPAFFSWLGTIHYLPTESVYATLDSISKFALAGSEIVFDYGIGGDMLRDADREALAELKRFVAKRGEPIISSFDPKILAMKTCELGFTLIEDMSYEQQVLRYFANRTDDLRPAAFSRIAHYRVG